MKRRYAAAAGVAGFVLVGLMGAQGQGHDASEATLAIEGRPGGVAITLSVGGKSREVVVEPVEGGQFRIRGKGNEGDLTAQRVRLTLGADRPMRHDTRFAPQPQAEDVGPVQIGRPPATLLPGRGFGILPEATFGRAKRLEPTIVDVGRQNVTAGIQITPRLSRNNIGDFNSTPPQPDLVEPMPRG